MLRAVRFAAKLGFEIDAATRAPITRCAELLANVPAARLFDEMLKLLLSGHAVACITRLRAEGLHHGLLPLLDVILEQPAGERFVMLALSRTDERVRAGKHVSPGFLFATLLWHEVLKGWQEARERAASTVSRRSIRRSTTCSTLQTEKLAIQRRFAADMREIWVLQPRFERASAVRPSGCWNCRASAPAMISCCCAVRPERSEAAIGEWWTRFLDGDEATREALVSEAAAHRAARRRAASGAGAAAAARGATTVLRPTRRRRCRRDAATIGLDGTNLRRRAYIGLGANLGESAETLEAARAESCARSSSRARRGVAAVPHRADRCERPGLRQRRGRHRDRRSNPTVCCCTCSTSS